MDFSARSPRTTRADSRRLRKGTRYAFARGYKKNGNIRLSVYLQQFRFVSLPPARNHADASRVGDVVDVVCNGAVQKGMPYKYYHGKTGVVYNVTKSSLGVLLQRAVGNRFIAKRINVRLEHVRMSRSREDFLRRVKTNAAKTREAKAAGEKVSLKRLPVGPRGPHTLDMLKSQPETIRPASYETLI
jgi:large subunit ribosomal protein L21e